MNRSVHYNSTLDRTFFALSDPTRRGILETVDLVVTAKVGRARECRLGPAQLEQASGWIEDYRRTWERRLDRFGAFAEDQQ